MKEDFIALIVRKMNTQKEAVQDFRKIVLQKAAQNMNVSSSQNNSLG